MSLIWLQLKAPLCLQLWDDDSMAALSERKQVYLHHHNSGWWPWFLIINLAQWLSNYWSPVFYCVSCILGRHLCWRCCKFGITAAVEVMATATYFLLLHICRHSLDCSGPRKNMSYWSAKQISTGFKGYGLYGRKGLLAALQASRQFWRDVLRPKHTVSQTWEMLQTQSAFKEKDKKTFFHSKHTCFCYL